MAKKIKLSNCIGPTYYDVYWDIQDAENRHYWFPGGRGSLKSSFCAIIIILILTNDYIKGKKTHAVGLRKVKETIRDSVYAKLLWAIDILGVGHLWETTTSPLKLWIGDAKNPHNVILFRGSANARDHEKIKSLTFTTGYCKIVWYEELPEFSDMDEIHVINQSLLRGGDEALALYSYNPPPSKRNWVNFQLSEYERLEAQGIDTKVYCHRSTYLDVPEKWLGKEFINEANLMKQMNFKKYLHMFMGESGGEGLEIFPSYDAKSKKGILEVRTIEDEEIRNFTSLSRGFDFGYSHATVYIECFYDTKTQIVYIYDEVYLYQASNYLIYSKVKPKATYNLIRGDHADPSTIMELNKLGLYIIPAIKGPDSKNHGLKWLQDRAKIVIDKKRCPLTCNDFEGYEYKTDKSNPNVIIYEYPDEPDGIAATRYALEPYIRQSQWQFIKK